MYQKELEMIVRAMKEAYYAHGNFSRVSDKERFDLVTDADENIEAFLLRRIGENYPEDRILSEETGHKTKIEGRTWTVDPIDGTVNMAKGLPLFGIQCSLFDGGECVMSAIWLPVFDECYTAIKGQGAYCNGEKLQVKPSEASRAVVSFGDFSHKRPDDFTDQHRMLYLLSTHVAKIRMFGSAAIDLAAVASGATNATVIFTKNQWDLAPGILLCREAGAVVTDPEGGEYAVGSRGVVAAADGEMADLIRECY